MKNFLTVFFSLLFYLTFGQNNVKYIFNVELNDYKNAPIFKFTNGVLVYDGSDIEEKDFFSKYSILKFYQTYPSSEVLKSLNIFTFESFDNQLMSDIVLKFPNKYLRIENLTNQLTSLNYYPNDYGTTSPNINLGANLSLKSFDYVNVPKAWDYFPPNQIGNVVIGISDGKVLNNDIDFIGKVTYLNENLFNTSLSCFSHTWHGVSVGAVAAAKGNNSHGISGVCSDCSIISIPHGNYNGLLELAKAGAKVINMSWSSNYPNDPSYLTGYVQSHQDIINEIHDMGVVLVGSSGNLSTNRAGPPYYISYGYPASYDNVISVSSVNSLNANFTDQITHEAYGDVSWFNEDLISETGIYNNGTFSSFYEGHTVNSKVDICGPGFQYPLYGSYLLGCQYQGLPFNYGDGTSGSAPFVTGTIALMQSLNPCLKPDEIEDILQLTAKNIESNPHNNIFIGKIGAGKLEVGDSVEFVYESMSSNGNVLIDGQDFWRFDFDLKIINNKLTISNQIFRDNNTSKFVAKNSININSNVDLKPNSNGFVDLKTDALLDIGCQPVVFNYKTENNVKNELAKSNPLISIYPNPNKGVFSIDLGEVPKTEIEVSIFDVLGKLKYNAKIKNQVFEINLPNLTSGIYLVKLQGENYDETIRFVKE